MPDDCNQVQTVNGKPRNVRKQDWPEDSVYTDGACLIKCTECGSIFIGHITRTVCRSCHTEGAKK